MLYHTLIFQVLSYIQRYNCCYSAHNSPCSEDFGDLAPLAALAHCSHRGARVRLLRGLKAWLCKFLFYKKEIFSFLCTFFFLLIYCPSFLMKKLRNKLQPKMNKENFNQIIKIQQSSIKTHHLCHLKLELLKPLTHDSSNKAIRWLPGNF